MTDCFYVPVYRDEARGDVLVQCPSPKLSFSLTTTTNTFESQSDRFSSSSSHSPFAYASSSSSLASPSATASCQHRLVAYVGPVSPTVANDIYERIRAPSRLRQSPSNRDILRSDELKGYERIARRLTDDLKVPWHEYWSFLDSYCNLKSADGLAKLEAYLQQRRVHLALDAQLKSAQAIIALSRRADAHDTQKQQLDAIVDKLAAFVERVDELKRVLELNEHPGSPYVLSKRYETFVSIFTFGAPHPAATPAAAATLVTQFGQFRNDEQMPSAERWTDKLLGDLLPNYMALVVELANVDKTSRCYFDLYKTAKSMIVAMRCERLFEAYRLSPVFKRAAAASNAAEKKEMCAVALKFDDDDDDDNHEPASNSKKAVEEVEEDDVMEMLTRQMNNLARPSLAVQRKDGDDNDDEIKRTFRESESSSSNTTAKTMVFMVGDAPSKIDRSVYIAVQEAQHIDKSLYPLLADWYDYMRQVNQSVMQQWRTPARLVAVPPRFAPIIAALR